MRPPLLLDIREACSALRVSKTTLYREIAADRLEAVSIGNRRLVPTAALLDYVERLRDEARSGVV